MRLDRAVALHEGSITISGTSQPLAHNIPKENALATAAKTTWRNVLASLAITYRKPVHTVRKLDAIVKNQEIDLKGDFMRNTQTMRLCFLVVISLAGCVHASGQQGGPPAGMGNACKFNAGPRSGQTQDYTQLGFAALGTPCYDGQGSTGTVVALAAGGGGGAQGGPPAGMGNACKFNAGPRSGQTQDYTQLGFAALGTPCYDGQGSTGTVVALAGGGGGGAQGGPPAGMGNACKFNAGPRSGQTQDYTQLGFAALGTPCYDGQGSTGTVVALAGGGGGGAQGGPPAGMGSACKFNAGPRSGQTQDYTQLGFAALGTPCYDGQGSTGTVVALAGSVGGAQQMAATPSENTPENKGKKCMVLRGPDAGSKETFPFPLPVSAPCLSSKGIGIIVQ